MSLLQEQNVPAYVRPSKSTKRIRLEHPQPVRLHKPREATGKRELESFVVHHAEKRYSSREICKQRKERRQVLMAIGKVNHSGGAPGRPRLGYRPREEPCKN